MVNHVLNQLVQEKLNRRLDEIYDHLFEIMTPEERERINLKLHVDSYRYPMQLNLRPHPVKKPRIKKTLPTHDQCLGRIGNRRQCSRKKINNTNFCRIHNNSLPYGRIDNELDGNLIKMNKRRGRKGRTSKSYTLDDLDHKLYVQAIVVVIDNEPFLLDENDVLYMFNANNEIVGRQLDNEVHWE
jgi:hypothetical protein